MKKNHERIESIRVKNFTDGQKIIFFGYKSSGCTSVEEFNCEIGTILLCKDNEIIVEFEKSRKSLHDACGLGKKNRCWTFKKSGCSIFEYSYKNKKLLKKYLKNRDSIKEIRDNIMEACHEKVCSNCPYKILCNILGNSDYNSVHYGSERVYNTYKNIVAYINGKGE